MASSTSLSILLIDAKPERLFQVASLLAVDSIRVLTAAGVDQAMEIGERESLDLLVCREPLDVGDSSFLLRFLRRNKRSRNLRLVQLDSRLTGSVLLRTLFAEPVYHIPTSATAATIIAVFRLAMRIPTLPSQPQRYPAIGQPTSHNHPPHAFGSNSFVPIEAPQQ